MIANPPNKNTPQLRSVFEKINLSREKPAELHLHLTATHFTLALFASSLVGKEHIESGEAYQNVDDLRLDRIHTANPSANIGVKKANQKPV
jgi:hypothetical protein